VPGLTVDRQCASGLDAILFAMRAVAIGQADVMVAGGAESVSTAPWRVAKPKHLFQTPRFIGLEQDDLDTADASQTVAEELPASPATSRTIALHLFQKAETAGVPFARRPALRAAMSIPSRPRSTSCRARPAESSTPPATASSAIRMALHAVIARAQ
jgi:hypothetical protein